MDNQMNQTPSSEEGTTVLTSAPDFSGQGMGMPQPGAFTPSFTEQGQTGPLPGQPAGGMAPQGMGMTGPMAGGGMQSPMGGMAPQGMGMQPMGQTGPLPGNGMGMQSPMGGMAPQGMGMQPMGQTGPLPGNGMSMQSPMGGMAPQGMGMQPGLNPMFGGNGGATPPKKKHTGLIIGIIAAVLVIAAALLVFVFDVFGLFKKEGKGPEGIAKHFIECMNDADVDGLLACIPKELQNGKTSMADLGSNKEEIKAALDMMKGFGMKMTVQEVKSVKNLDAATVKSDIDSRDGVNLNISEAAEVTLAVNTKVEFMGEKSDETADVVFTCVKIGSKWYVVDMNSGDSQDTTEWSSEPTETAASTEEPTDTATDTTTESAGPSNVPSHVVAAPAGLSENLADFQIYFDGKVYKVPFDASELAADWKLDEEIEEDDKELDPNDDSWLYEIANDKYDEWFTAYVKYVNLDSAKKPYDQCKITYLSLDIGFCDTDNVPEVIMPKGITWHSSKEDIIAAYGEPQSNNHSEYNDILDYEFNEYDDIEFYVDPEKGLTEIDISFYSY